MQRILSALLLALLLVSSLQDRAWAASTPPEKTASGSPGENPNKHATFNPVLTIQLQRDAAMWGEGTVLDVDVGPNLYAYTRQNPWSGIDPDGLATLKELREKRDKLRQRNSYLRKRRQYELRKGRDGDARMTYAEIGRNTPQLSKLDSQIEKLEQSAKAISLVYKMEGLEFDPDSLDNTSELFSDGLRLARSGQAAAMVAEYYGGRILGTVGSKVVGGLVSRIANRGAGRITKIWCFPPETHILMGDGSTKEIQDVKIGDKVLAHFPSTGVSQIESVVDILQSQTKKLIRISFSENQNEATFRATGTHPIWTQNRGWIEAQDIAPGDVLRSQNMETYEVSNVEIEHIYSKTYNLTVSNAHTFFVVPNGIPILVHNGERPRIHYALEDMVQKGMHVTSEGIELGIRGGGDSIKIVPIFGRDQPSNAQVKRAMNNLEDWLHDKKFRNELLKKTKAMTGALGKGSLKERAASGSTRALEVSLERWCK